MKALKAILALIFLALIVALVLIRRDKPRHHDDDDEAEPYEAVIKVVDAETGEPLHGATVEIASTDTIAPSDTLTTHSRGLCTFLYADPDAELVLALASMPEYTRGRATDIQMKYFETDTLVIPLEKREIGGRGGLKVTLMWDNPSIDLDLHIKEFNDFEINYENLTDPSTGGTLDVDWYPGHGDPDRIGENCVWPTPPSGTYQIRVECFNPEDAPRVPFDVFVYYDNHATPDEQYHLVCNGYHDVQYVTTVTIR